MKTILFSGTHGVGKGFFLDKVKEGIQNYNIYSASALIQKYKPATDAGYKKVQDVNGNQDVLVKAIKEIKTKCIDGMILDGHLCVFNADGEVERIPESFFVDAKITGIIILQDEPLRICERLRKRDSKDVKIQDIESMQNEERRYASELDAKLQIKHVIITHECTKEQLIQNLIYIGGDRNE